MDDFIFNLMSNFIIRDQLYTNVDDLSTAEGIKELLDVDVSLKRSQLFSRVADVGTKVKLLLLYEYVSDIDTIIYWKDCVKFCSNATDDLIQNVPFNEILIQHAQYFNPRNRAGVKSPNAISNLALKLGRCFESALHCVYCFVPHEKVEDLCDKVRTQCESEQNMFIDEELKNQVKQMGKTNRVSY